MCDHIAYCERNELKVEIDRLRADNEKLRARLGPRGLEVIEIDGAGHYVNEKVKAELDRLRAELANARLERDNIAALNSSLIAELAEARRALLAGNDTVLANKKLQEDNAAKDRIIANLDERSARYERDSVAKDARIAELEERCAVHARVVGALERTAAEQSADPSEDDLTIPLVFELVAAQNRAERAEAERDVLWKALEHFVVWWDSLPSGMDDRPLELEEWVNSERCKTVVEQARAALAPSPARREE